VVTARGRAPLDVLIRAGRILALVPRGAVDQGPAAGTAAGPADGPEEIDATGLLVLPGFVDTHVHLMEPGDGSREDFPAGTSAALHQGVTTIVEHTHGWPVTTAGRLREKLAAVRGRSWVDFGLAAHVWPDHLDDLAALWHDGVSFFKIFTCDTHGIPGLGTDLLLDALGLLAGLGAPCLIHCEDGPITAAAQHRLQRMGRDDPWILPEWRSREAELVATTTACLLTRLTGARTTIAHASCAEVVEVVSAAAAAGADVVAESCPQYLLLAEAEVGEHAALRKFTPPARIRASRDGDRMWAALHDRHIHHLSSDHAPSTRAQKADGSIWDAHFGLPGLDTTAPLLIDAALSGRVPLERVVEAYATAPARRYRLRGKGDLLPGCDGDLVLIDPGARWELGDSHVRSKAGWTPYAGRVVRGKVAGTILRGSLAAWQGEHTGEPGGRFVAGPGSPTGR
jgi:dihydroorotase (multifunctional complex type)